VGASAVTLLEALAVAFAARQRQLFDIGEPSGGEPSDSSTSNSASSAEARVSCAAAAVLLGWLMHREPSARIIVASRVGPTEGIIDVVRQFVVFQDKCGVLTDASLVSLHAVMLSMADKSSNSGPHTEVRCTGTQEDDPVATVQTPAAEPALTSRAIDASGAPTGSGASTASPPRPWMLPLPIASLVADAAMPAVGPTRPTCYIRRRRQPQESDGARGTIPKV